MKILRYITYLLIAPALAVALASCQEDVLLKDYDYTSMGEDVILTVPVSLPEMDVKSRANLSEWQINQVNNVWIRTYSAITGEATSKWVEIEDLNLHETETEQSVEIKSKSGMSYIVAVANVDNLGVTKDKPTEQKKLRDLLADPATAKWEGFLNIAAVVPSTYETVNAPSSNNGLPMAGAYTNIKVGKHSTSIEDWQKENFTSYAIPASGTGTVELKDGAIHLRRLVSQIVFNLMPGSDIILNPSSYQIINVPRYSWVYERAGELANFGDNAKTEEVSAEYYVNPSPYYSSSFENGATEGSYTFNFWQGENKHTALQDITTYKQRQTQAQVVIGAESNSDKWKENTGYFLPLTGGDIWTPNNMATYVLINCHVEHKGNLWVNDDGQTDKDNSTTEVEREGFATYIIHLGYMGAKEGDAASIAKASKDFNCYRNTKYTYNVTVNGLNDIRVEAFHEPEVETPGVEGIVADTTNPTIQLDCHYHSFNIQLSSNDLKKWDPVSKEGFGFIITTYDNAAADGVREKTYQETDFDKYATYDDIPDDIKKYVNWIELRPTSDKNMLATYLPRNGVNNTFNLIDAAKGNLKFTPAADGYYTVFVNEYTYEAPNADETYDTNGRSIWHSYVNADARRFFIRVTRSTSADGESIYARSKYAASQQSILTYYTNQVITEPENTTEGANQERGSALGVERENESFGLNMRRSFSAVANRINGRYNTWQFTQYRYNNGWKTASNDQLNDGWSYFLVPNEPQQIPAGNTGNPAQTLTSEAGPVKLPKIANYLGTFNPLQWDPQESSKERNDYIEAINACMNRNRDNNGDGRIDQSELRWYVPAISKYLRLLLGSESLSPYALMEYGGITQLDPANTSNNGRYRFFASDGLDLWAMEGMSTSSFGAYGAAPWQVRCVRNLGTNLGSEIQALDKTIPAYTHTKNGTGGIVEMTYYQIASKRVTPFRAKGNGNSVGQMPVNTIDDYSNNSIYQGGFEISPGANQYNNTNFRYDGTIYRNGDNDWSNLKTKIESSIDNPCVNLSGEGWRLPNIKELAIMKNLGYFVGCPRPVLSCSMSAFDANGTKTTPTTNTGVVHYFISANNDIITQGNGGYGSTDLYIRCVRDYTGN